MGSEASQQEKGSDQGRLWGRVDADFAQAWRNPFREIGNAHELKLEGVRLPTWLYLYIWRRDARAPAAGYSIPEVRQAEVYGPELGSRPGSRLSVSQ
jgi:hypothetical protein